MSMPPEILLAMKAAIAQEERRELERERVKRDIIDLVAEMGVPMTPDGIHALVGLASTFIDILHRDCGDGCEGEDPLDMVRLADNFMRAWALRRFRNNDELGLQVEDSRLEVFYAPDYDLKVVSND